MKIVEVAEKYYRDVLALSQYAFQYQIPEDRLQDRLKRLDSRKIFGVFDNEALCANLHMIPFEVFVAGNKVKMGGIASVATYPEHRRKGYVKELITSALTYMKENGYVVSMLHPFQVSFYRKYGWELLSNRLISTLKKEDLKLQIGGYGTIKRFKKEKHTQDIEQVYEKFAEKYTGMLVRDTNWWLQSVYSDLHAAVYYENEEPTGYILYEVKNSKMIVEEFVPLTNDARIGLWNYICQHDSMINELEMITPVDEPLFFTLQEPRINQQFKPYFMVRIVDVEAFLNQYPFNWNNNEELLLKITDPYAPWNEKTYVLKNHEVSVVQGNVNQSQTIQMSIQTLSAILFGYKRVSEMYQLEHILGEEKAVQQFENIIPKQKSFFYDFF